ncbi:MAG: metal ABC transporter permease [Burkholderiales bacterium]|nr:metal ABC transporter permease [Burkholderiales bacterium]
MSVNVADLSIIGPAFLAGLLVIATHVPLGTQVLSRGIVFVDLAVAQIAGLGVIVAAAAGFEAESWAVQAAALSAALLGALALTWTEKKYPEVQEAIIGVAFILAASGAVVLLAGNVHAGENLRDLLVGQILWVPLKQLPLVALIDALILVVWFGWRGELSVRGFYLLFACAVTVSVQLVGIYLVFASLIIPPLATRHMKRFRLPVSYALGTMGYACGLAVSVAFDLPSGPTVVWALALLGIAVHVLVSAKTD